MEIAADTRGHSRRHSGWRTVWALLTVLAAATMSGCGGCWGQSLPTRKATDLEAELNRKPPEKPKPPFEPIKIAVLPEDDSEGNVRYIKPGHWTTTVVQTKANLNDFVGDLAFTPLDQSLAPALLDRTRFSLTCIRPASLPKGQEKFFEQLVYVPRGRSTTSVALQLRERRGGGVALRDSHVLTHLAAYQYQLLVLAANPNQYRYLKVLDSVRPRNADLADADQVWYYHVCLPRVLKQAPVSGEPLAWTSTSHLIWDDLDFKLFRPDQQQAMIDWLHWGGHLIISGPQSLDGLKGSFLEPYLPATSAGPLELGESELAPLRDSWTRSEGSGPGQPPASARPWNGVRLQLAPGGAFVPDTGSLAADRRVGRGRVLVTAFRLSQRELLSWRSFDSFFNACILARPPRRFVEQSTAVTETAWEGLGKNRRLDPDLVTHVRYFTRDSSEKYGERPAVSAPEEADRAADVNVLSFPAAQNYTMVINESRKEPGAAGWHDFNDVGDLARQSLRGAAGITIPEARFVAQTLALYLLVVVPLNWLVFKAIGRVEWAWAATPVLALIGAGAVIKLARLDIGFARSRNEISVLEVHGDYPRAHLTRYTALYTSLATGYDCRLSGAAAALPFGRETLQLRNETLGSVELRRDAELRLDGFEVISNAADLLHTEQFVDLRQGFAWSAGPGEAPQVANGANFNLHGVVVSRRPGLAEGDAALETAWIGELPAGSAAQPRFEADGWAAQAEHFEESPETQRAATKGALNIRGLIELASRERLEPGEVRLVGWTEEMLPGATIEPSASQVRHAMIAVVHLRPGELPPARPDEKLPPVYVPPPEDEGLPLQPPSPETPAASPPASNPAAP